MPRRKLALGALALAAVAAVALALIIPPLESGKRAGAAERAHRQAAAIAAEAARLRADQRLHLRTAPAGADLVTALENAITTDARARERAGTISGPVLSTRCSATTAGVVQYPQSRVYKCFVRTSTGHQGVLEGDEFGTGYPFVATIYEHTRRLAWCKQNPKADEKGSKLAHIRVSPVCAGKLARVL